MSNTWEMLAYFEASEANKKLDEIREDNEAHRQRQEQLSIDKDINYLLQELYRVRGDVSKVNLFSVEKIKRDIERRYHFIYSRRRPEKNVLYIILIVFMSIASITVYAITKNSVVAGIPSMIILYSIYQMIQIKNNINSYDSNIERKKNEVYFLKHKYGNTLTALGLFSKYYIDDKTEGVLNQLIIQGESPSSVFSARKSLYKLFGFEVDPREDEDLRRLWSWNYDLLTMYDHISMEDANKNLNSY
jgi:hypothetical protein